MPAERSPPITKVSLPKSIPAHPRVSLSARSSTFLHMHNFQIIHKLIVGLDHEHFNPWKTVTLKDPETSQNPRLLAEELIDQLTHLACCALFGE